MKLNPKQSKALLYLQDDSTTELLYGGGAGGGKSILGAYWLTKAALRHQGTRWLMGRAVMKTLKETTYQSFLKVAKMQGLTANTHFRITSAQDKDNPNAIVFPNDSVILMKDLNFYPNDPEFDELGSLEITGAFIDEANQVTEKAKSIVGSRIRHELNGMKPKMLMTCNPAKNWTYQSFYKPSKEGVLLPYRKFIQALVGDNPDIDPNYKENLFKLDERSKQRLLYGNWEFDDDPATLINYDKIIDCFSNSHVPPGDKKITSDIARLGGDKIVIAEWNGFRCKISWKKKEGLNVTGNRIEEARTRLSIGKSDVLVDEDGVGGGVVDFMGYKGFVNGSRPLTPPGAPKDALGKPIPENYSNLKSQCSYRMADRINKGGLYIECEDIEIKQWIIEEMEQVKQHNMDKDGKKQVTPKEIVKQLLGRSPDFWETIMMREWFELSPKRVYADALY